MCSRRPPRRPPCREIVANDGKPFPRKHGAHSSSRVLGDPSKRVPARFQARNEPQGLAVFAPTVRISPLAADGEGLQRLEVGPDESFRWIIAASGSVDVEAWRNTPYLWTRPAGFATLDAQLSSALSKIRFFKFKRCRYMPSKACAVQAAACSACTGCTLQARRDRRSRLRGQALARGCNEGPQSQTLAALAVHSPISGSGPTAGFSSLSSCCR